MSNNINIYNQLADMYDTLHPGRDADKFFYSELVSCPAMDVLDVACGTGILTKELSNTDARVTGIDGSPAMLKIAQARLPNLRFYNADMRDFNLGETFDLIICCNNTIQHLETDKEIVSTLSSMRRHLKRGGRIAFDIFNPSTEYLANERLNIAMRRIHNSEGSTQILYEDTSYDSTNALLSLTWRIVDENFGTILRESSCTMRQIFPEELDSILFAAGLTSIAVYGDFDRSPFLGSAPRQVVLAEVFR
ncbi:class I SAM-dependent methyltransferase [Lentilitoribacter sp. EG35]|uniref:class I SAM-dependent methyltransferase n=1 Tax=Lentilitoribacter sp. EG35 TaxID=3234192 RepID=UPI003460C6E3